MHTARRRAVTEILKHANEKISAIQAEIEVLDYALLAGLIETVAAAQRAIDETRSEFGKS